MFFPELQDLETHRNMAPRNVEMKIIAQDSRGTRMGHLRIARSIMSILKDSKIGEILFGISTTLFTVIRYHVALLVVLHLLDTIHGSMILEMSDHPGLHQGQSVER